MGDRISFRKDRALLERSPLGDERPFDSAALVIGVLLALWMTAQIHRFTVATYIGATPIMADFGITATGAGLLAAVYFPAYGLVQIPSGIMADVLRPKLILIVGGLLFAASTLLFAAAPTLELAVVARILVGLSSGFLWLSSLKICAALPDVSYPRAVSFMVALGSLGSVAALAGLPVLVSIVDWRTATALITGLTLIACLGLTRVRTPDATRATSGESSTVRLRQGLASSLLGLRDVLRGRRYWQIFLPAMMWNGGQFALLSWLPRYARDVLGLPSASVGILPALMPIGLIIGSLAIGWSQSRYPSLGMKPFYVNVAGWAVVLAIIISGIADPLGAPGLYGLVFCLGLLYGSWFMGLSQTGQLVPPHLLGTATGVVNGLGFLPAFVLPWLMGGIMDAVDQPTSPDWTYSAAAFRSGFLLVLLGVTASLVGALALARGIGRRRA